MDETTTQKFLVNPREVWFSTSFPANSNDINLDNLGENGKLSLRGAAIILLWFSQMATFLAENPGLFVNFGAIPGVSKKDSSLLCCYVIYSSRSDFLKNRDFDFDPLMPTGLGIQLRTVDHFFMRVDDDNLEPSETVTSILKVTKIMLSPGAQAYLREFAEAAPELLAAIQRGVKAEDVPHLLTGSKPATGGEILAPSQTKPPLPSSARAQFRATILRAADNLALPPDDEGQGGEAARPDSLSDLNLTTAQVAKVIDDTRLSRLLFRYEKRVREIDLPPEGFKSKEQADAAARLAATYRELRKAQIELGCTVTPKSPRVTEADRLRVAFDRNRRKTEIAAGPQ